MVGSPLDRLTSVDGLGAFAASRPLTLRFDDALRFQPEAQRTPNLFRDGDTIPLFQQQHRGIDIVIRSERYNLCAWRHLCSLYYNSHITASTSVVC